MIKLTTDLANEQEYKEKYGKEEFVYNDDTQEWERIVTPPSYISMKQLKDKLRGSILEMKDMLLDKSTSFLLEELQRKLKESQLYVNP